MASILKCSRCNLVPIQIQYVDDYLCEQDHIVCKKCLISNQEKQLICPLCQSRIVKNRKFSLEKPTRNIGNNNIINKNNNYINNNYNNDHDKNVDQQFLNTISKQNFSEGGNSLFNEEIRVILQSPMESLNSYQNSENNNTNSGDNSGGGMHYHMGDVYCNDPTAIRFHADENLCFEGLFLKNEIFDATKDIIDDDNGILKLMPELAEKSCTENHDAMLLYHKQMNGKSDPNFDPQRHFYQTMHFLNEKNEVNRRPSLIPAKKSIDKINDNYNKNNILVNETESSLVLKRYAECQRESNYKPIIAFTYNSIINGTGPEDLPTDSIVQTIYERPHTNTTNNNNCNNKFKNNTKDIKQDKYNHTNKIKQLQSNNNNTNINNNNINNNNNNNNLSNYCQKTDPINIQPSKRTMLRNQIIEMTYSNVKDNSADDSDKSGKFIAHNSTYKPSPLISLHIDKGNGEHDKSSFYTGILQHHLSKAMQDLLANEQNSRNARREKRQLIVQKERETIRNRIKDQIYKKVNSPNLNNNGDNDNNNNGNNDNNNSSNNNNNGKHNNDLTQINNISNQHKTQTLQIITPDEQILPSVNDNCDKNHINKEYRNISLSTESYPKLNPHLSLTLSNFDKKYSKLHEESFDEIKKQFEKQTKLELELIAAIENKNSLTKQVFVEHSTYSNSLIENNELINQTPIKQISQDNNNNIKIQSLKSITSKQSQISELCEGLNIETLTTNVETLHEVPELRKLKITNSQISLKTIKNNDNNESCLSIKNPEICITNLNTIEIINQKLSEDNLLYQKEIENFAQTLNCNQNSNKEFDDNEKVNCIDNDNSNNNDNQNSIKNFIDLLQIKNPSMTTDDLYDLIKYLPAATSSQINKAMENLPTVQKPKQMLQSNCSSDTIIDNETLCSEITESEIRKNILDSTNNAWRAYYSPPIDYCCEPEPQLRPIKLSKKIIFKMEPKPAGQLNIERHPVNCPITSCKRKVFISEFTKHMKVDHTKTFIESISPGECRNLFFDPKVVHYGINKCHSLYLLTDKIRDLGSREYKNYLPIMLMSTKVSLIELISSTVGPKDDEVKNCKQYFIVVWLTGLVASEIPIYYTLVIWSRSSVIPKCHIVHSGTLYSFREEQSAKALFKRGQGILLSKQHCDLLTDHDKNMIELQVIIH